MLVSTRLPKLHAAVVRAGVFAGSGIVALGLLGSSAALAQNCTSTLGIGIINANFGGTVIPVVRSLLPAVAAATSGSAAVNGAVTAANTAFLSQSSAFVSAPANPKPDAEGAGIWIRGAGGELTLNSNSRVTTAVTGPMNFAGGTTCNSQFYQTFGGFQLGMDMAKLNAGGWNLTLGTTAGFLQTTGDIVNGSVVEGNGSFNGPSAAFNSVTQAPFVGIYGTATYGNFYVDGLVRGDYFQTEMNSPSTFLFNQKTEAHGITLAASTGYSWAIPNSSWFIEPSVGMIWSRESVDPLQVASPLIIFPAINNVQQLFSGTAQVNDLESIIGRAGLRVGTTFEGNDIVYSPFAAVSVWHDFSGDITTSYASCPGCLGTFMGVPANQVATISTNNIGTFGQYSAGVSGQLKNTGWFGFARVDYREGPEVHGLSGTGGIRYQFNPTASALPVKAKAPVDHPVNWSGWYGGVIGGATELGGASLTFPGTSTAQTRPSGWLGGGTLGFNLQSGNWVYGLEGDIAGTNTNGSSPCAPLTADPNLMKFVGLFQTTCHDSLDWVVTATARLGYAWTPRSLLYVKAGGAFADERASVTCNYGTPFQNMVEQAQGCVDPAVTHLLNQASVSALRTGWTAGIGTEFALTSRWSIKGEFDWLDFGTKALTLSDGTAVNSKLHVAEAKIGLNYKFWPGVSDPAADLELLPVTVAPRLPVKAARASTWDGFYVGASVGWEQTSSNWTTSCFTILSTCPDPNFLPPDATRSHTFDMSGARVGTYFGINWQVASPWLVGLEADVGYNDRTSTTEGIPGCTIQCIAGLPAGVGGITPAGDSASVRTTWDGSLRARAGYLVTPALLAYGTGGVAERMIDASLSCTGGTSPRCFVGNVNESQTLSGHVQTGWTVGAGLEWKALDNVILRGEYRYSDYGNWSPTFFTGPTFAGNNPYETHANIGSSTHAALFGVSYLFGGRPLQ